MQVYDQGEEYQEEEFTEDEFDESEEDTESRITSFYGFPIKNVVIIGAAILVVIIGIVIFATRKTKEPSSELSSDFDAQLSEALGNTDTSDSFGASAPVASDTSTGGEAVFNPETGLWETAPADTTTATEPVATETATDEERLKLRAMGYSGDEIDVALSEGFSVQALIDAAQELYDAEADAALRRMSDSASEEFRYIIENSYFGQPGYEFVSLKDEQFGTYNYSQGSYTVNADYIKMPTYGSQLQLKCRVAQDLWVFYQITPERFDQLPAEGNIVLRVNYTQYGVNTYVTSVTETDPTLDTIDSSSATVDTITDNQDNTVDADTSETEGIADESATDDVSTESFGESEP